MKNKFLKCLTLASVVLVFNACGTKDDVVAPTPTRTQLVAKTWKVTALTISPALQGITNVFSFIDACDADNLLKLNINANYSNEEGATKCDPRDPQIIETGTWKLVNNDTQIELKAVGSNTAEILPISSVTATQLVLTEKETINGIVYTYTLTHTAQ